jgi:hypothetical protein
VIQVFTSLHWANGVTQTTALQRVRGKSLRQVADLSGVEVNPGHLGAVFLPTRLAWHVA